MQRRSALQQIALFGIMMVMLFIVLSTATYAWYSANNVASVDGLTFTSSAVGSESGLLAIGPTADTTSTSMAFDPFASGATLSPMIPVNASIVETTTYSAFVANFNKTSEGLKEDKWVAKIAGQAATPTTLTCGNGSQVFYVRNMSMDDVFNVKIEYTFDEQESEYMIKDKLHIAFFIGSDPTTATLLGVASLSNIHYGAIEAGQEVATTPIMEGGVRKDSGEMSFVLNYGETAVLRAVVWLDGVDMHNEHGNKSMQFALTFKGEKQ